jgi:uncharacterized membrane protein
MQFEPTITTQTINQLEHQTLMNVWIGLLLGLSQFVALAACIFSAFRKTTAALVCFLVFGFLVLMVGNELGVTVGCLILGFAVFGLVYGRIKKREANRANEASANP